MGLAEDLGDDPAANSGAMFVKAFSDLREMTVDTAMRQAALESFLIDKGILTQGDVREMEKAVAVCKAKMDQGQAEVMSELLGILDDKAPDLAKAVRDIIEKAAG